MYDSGGFAIWSQYGPPVVSAPEEIDIYNTEQLLHSLLLASAKATVIVVDMTATTICAASGINVLAWTAQWLKDNDGEMRLVCAARLQRIMTVTGTDRLFRFFAALPEALTAKPSHSKPDSDIDLGFPMPPRDSRPDPGHDRVTTCAWCHQTPSVSWRQRRREYEHALSCHQAHGTPAVNNGQDGNALHTAGLIRRLVRPVHERHLSKTAA